MKIGIKSAIVLFLLPAGCRHPDAADTRPVDAAAEVATVSRAAWTFAFANGVYPPQTFRLASSYADESGNPLAWPEVVFLVGAFPAVDLTDTGYRRGGRFVNPADADQLDANQTLTLWLTGGAMAGYGGLSADPKRPLSPLGAVGPRLRPLFNGRFHDGRTVDPWGRPYAVVPFKGGFPAATHTAVAFAAPDR